MALIPRRRKGKANPRTAPTGTTYQSKGIQSAAPPQINVETGSSRGTQIRETVPQLVSGFQRAQTYQQMMRYASVDMSIRLYKTPVLGAEFYVDPFSDDPVDQEIAEFINANLFEGMSAPFSNALEDILCMYEDGYSIIEKVHESREWAPRKSRSAANTKNFTMLKKLASRPILNVGVITYDDQGGPKTIEYNAIQGDNSTKEVKLDISKIVIFTFNKKGGDVTGKSLLRTAYPHWYYMNHFYKIDSIQKERHAIGIPKATIGPGASRGDKELIRQALRNLRTNEESFIIETPGITITFDKPLGAMVDVLASANHHNAMILLNVLGQFMSLSHEGAGSGRATAATQSDMFMKSLKFVANRICEQINMYVIPELVVWNYPTKNFPQLKVRNIGETRDLQMFAAGIANLYAQDALTKGDAVTENFLRQIFDLPSISADQVKAPSPSGGVDTNPATPPSNGNGNGNGVLPQDVATNLRGAVKPTTGTGNVGKPNNAPQ